ncbi:hypothetical protein PLICRDRAFT_35653 [Plicaturopsis crispa FD-325 SS-3]|nr:hypothetical protein PLICRDRAFT_35653 [Plicaturopsis crispa FD-325 SS-3]
MLSRNLARLIVQRSICHGQRVCLRQISRQYASPSSVIAAQRHRRHMSTPPPQLNVSELSMERYHELSDATMDTLLESLEDLLDGLANPAYEVEYSSGVLTLILGDKGTYVINKQPPNKQIWLSSPFSGPKRYDYSAPRDTWLYSRDDRPLGDLLDQELSDALGFEVKLGVDVVSQKVESS